MQTERVTLAENVRESRSRCWGKCKKLPSNEIERCNLRVWQYKICFTEVALYLIKGVLAPATVYKIKFMFSAVWFTRRWILAG